MNIFNRNKEETTKPVNQSALAETALSSIQDGVVITDKNGVVKFINPAACRMLGISTNRAIGLDYGLIMKLESKEGRELSDRENPLKLAMTNAQSLQSTQVTLIAAQSNQRLPVAISLQVADDSSASRVIIFRDIAKELEEEGEQTEFISTASHEMRTPVATIDGYISLALNPQTATIDERARGYLTAAEKASKHLGKLFQDLLDVTKLDDGHIKAHFEPVEMIELIKSISDDYVERAKEAKLTYTFGSSEPVSFGGNRRMEQVVYGYVDTDYLREIVDNLIENAIKYTPAGGSIYVNVRGDGDRILINVTDTGMGISAEDLGHIFQKFYRVDNSDTRTIGGTGLGLYLVKQRTEAMGGKVWAESAFGEGSTFYVSLPRITSDEYEKRMIMVRNQQMMNQQNSQSPKSNQSSAQTLPATPPQTLPGQVPILPSQPNNQSPIPPQPAFVANINANANANASSGISGTPATDNLTATTPQPVVPAQQPAPLVNQAQTPPVSLANQVQPSPALLASQAQNVSAPITGPIASQQPVNNSVSQIAQVAQSSPQVQPAPQSVTIPGNTPQPNSGLAMQPPIGVPASPVPIPPPAPQSITQVNPSNNNNLNGENK